MAAPLDIARIQGHFHALIAKRAEEFGLPAPTALPVLDMSLLGMEQEAWHPVPGMYGGFAYRLHHGPHGLELRCSSWSRIMDGSGMAHTITGEGAVLTDSGFV
jgi:hypothetical protein